METRKWLVDTQVNLVPSVDLEILTYFLKQALDLPSSQKIAAVERIFNYGSNGVRSIDISGFVNSLYERTKLGTTENRLKMFGMNQSELEKLDDPFINFARQLEQEREELQLKKKDFSGASSRLNSRLIEAISEWKKGRLYPDANGTMRFTFGQVKGYNPRDAVTYKYITTLTGVLEKDTGREPFDTPDELKEAYGKKKISPYLDASIADIPVDFLSSCDITNGNSGSAVMNGKGELVGLAFDGNWESITSDYLFQPALTRALNVDIRYILFLMDKVYHADALLRELSVQQ